VRRLAERTSPALAAALGGTAANVAIPAEEARRSRLYNRFVQQAGLAWAARALREGIEVVCLDGLACAWLFYDDPELRTVAAADLLVRGRDLPRLADFLRRHGLAVPGGSGAGLRPVLSPDGSIAIHLHRQPDAWPVHRGLAAELAFRDSRPLTVDGLRVRVPSTTHCLLLAATWAARGRFGPDTVGSVIDAGAILRKAADQVDWPELLRLARRGGMRRPVGHFFALLDLLGIDVAAVPAPLRRPPRGPAGAELAHAVAAYEALFPEASTGWAALRREWLLSAGPRVAAVRGLARLAGLARRRRAAPGAGA
jgi:hypothetical protein